jgi:hypothetical protein
VPDLVVDASIALAWGMPDEYSSYAIAALAAVEQNIMYVPDLWAYEVANVWSLPPAGSGSRKLTCKHSPPRSHVCVCAFRAPKR